MKSRILTAIVGIPLLLVVAIFSHTAVMPFIVGLFCLVGVIEMMGCFGCKRKLEITVPAVIYSLAFTIGAYFFIKYVGSASYFLAIAASVTFVFIFYLMCLAVFSKGTKDISHIALVAVSTIYITAGFASLVILRGLDAEGVKNYGMCLFVLVFVGAWVPDGAGYFGGRAFGKHKLIPDVSPKKTVEGAVFGVVFGAISFVVTGVIMNLLGYGDPNYIALSLVGLAVAVVSICGDLIASLIKRKYGIKDYGKLFPGHGGVMDRFDSIIAIAPFLLMICSHTDVMMLFR